jgi:hypothetical protein
MGKCQGLYFVFLIFLKSAFCGVIVENCGESEWSRLWEGFEPARYAFQCGADRREFGSKATMSPIFKITEQGGGSFQPLFLAARKAAKH